MRYKTIRINAYSGRWIVAVYSDDTDREPTVTHPSFLGFFHYPVDMPDGDAFELLQKCMVARLQEEIDKLQESKDKLQALCFSDV